MNKIYKFLSDPYLNALLLGSVVGGLFLYVFIQDDWLLKYQSLLAGLLALVAALITVVVMLHNHKDSIDRKRLAVKAQMHDAAAEICDYTKECFDFLLGDSDTPPQAPKDALYVFKEGISFLEKDAIDFIAKFVSEFQVVNSRMVSYIRATHHSSNVKEERLYDVIRLRCMTHWVFRYARDKIDPVDLKRLDMHSALANLESSDNTGIAEHKECKAELTNIEEIIDNRHSD